MNVLFFLTPKHDVAYISDTSSVRQALEKMEHHGYTAIPILDSNGKYIGILTEGDLLRAIKNDYNMDLKTAEQITIASLKRQNRFSESVTLNTNIEDLIETSLNQNFVPVTTEDGIFMGIVTRKAIIKYFYEKHNECAEKAI